MGAGVKRNVDWAGLAGVAGLWTGPVNPIALSLGVPPSLQRSGNLALPAHSVWVSTSSPSRFVQSLSDFCYHPQQLQQQPHSRLDRQMDLDRDIEPVQAVGHGRPCIHTAWQQSTMDGLRGVTLLGTLPLSLDGGKKEGIWNLNIYEVQCEWH
ncbi:hypothetical protein Mapa_000579 [Marchantia paleacea]|nr:hypothetical protein Mapa_000579 [Marchantia paleacea]